MYDQNYVSDISAMDWLPRCCRMQTSLNKHKRPHVSCTATAQESYQHPQQSKKYFRNSYSTSFVDEASAWQAVTKSEELLRLIRDLLTRVQNQLALPIPNVTLIGLLQNETLALQLTRTPEQVNNT